MKIEFMKGSHPTGYPVYFMRDYVKKISTDTIWGPCFVHTMYRTGGTTLEQPEIMEARLADLGNKNWITLTQTNDEKIDLCVSAIMLVCGAAYGSIMGMVDVSIDVKETPEQIFTLIEQL